MEFGKVGVDIRVNPPKSLSVLEVSVFSEVRLSMASGLQSGPLLFIVITLIKLLQVV